MFSKNLPEMPQGLSEEGQKIASAMMHWAQSLNLPGMLNIAEANAFLKRVTASSSTTLNNQDAKTIGTSLYVGNNVSDNGTDICAIWMNQLHTSPTKYAILDGGVLTQAYSSQPAAGQAIGSALDRWIIPAASTLNASATLTIDESNGGTIQVSAFADVGKTLNLTLARALKIHSPTLLGSGTKNITEYHGLDVEDQSGFGTGWSAIRLRPSNYISSRNNANSANVNLIGLDASDKVALGSVVSGSWTPIFTFGTPGNLAVTYTTQTGTYVKIGQLVVATCNILTSAFTHSTASGVAVVAGLPYSAGSTPLAVGGSVIFRGITKAGYTTVSPGVATTTNYILLTASGSGVTPSNVAVADMPTGGTVELDFTVIYTV